MGCITTTGRAVALGRGRAVTRITGRRVATRVGIAVAFAVGMAVGDGEGDAVAVGEGVIDAVAGAVGVVLGVAVVRVGVAVGVAVLVDVAVPVAVAVLVGVSLGVGVSVGVAVAVLAGVLVGVTVSVALVSSPITWVGANVEVALMSALRVICAVWVVGVSVLVAVGVAPIGLFEIMTPAAATLATTTPPNPNSTTGTRRTGLIDCTCAIAAAISPAVWKRSCGFLAIALCTISRTAGVISMRSL